MDKNTQTKIAIYNVEADCAPSSKAEANPTPTIKQKQNARNVLLFEQIIFLIPSSIKYLYHDVHQLAFDVNDFFRLFAIQPFLDFIAGKR